MDLKTVLPKKRSKKKEYFWSLVLEQDWVQAGIWEVVEDSSRVVVISPAVHWKTDDELLTSIDTALSAAVSELEDEKIEPSKTVFGVPDSWVDEGQISDSYLGKIKKICKELSLTPTGFVVLPEAVAHFYKSIEKSAFNGVILGLSSESIEVSLVKDGNLIGTQNVARSVSLVNDVVEGLVRFSLTEPLPSRFVIFDGKEVELEEARQELMKADWQSNDKISILHTPKIEILEPKDKVLAVSLAGGSEIADTKKVSVVKKQGVKDEELSKDGQELIQVDKATSEKSVGSLGFVLGEDVAEELSKDVKSEPQPQNEISQKMDGHHEEIIEKEISSESSKEKKSILEKIGLASLLSKFKLPEKSKDTFQPPSKRKRLIIIGAIAFLILVIGGFFLWWYFPKATVTIYISPKQQEESVTLFVDPSATSVDAEKNILPGDVKKVSLSGERTASVTGTKTVGEKAKGSVEIRNGTSSPVKVVAGAVLVSANDLNFVADNTASVSAAISPTEPGTATIEVTAEDNGSEYNLAKEEVFTIGDYDKAEVDAISLSDFSGGTSREISVVSSSDRKSLQDELEEELLEKAIKEIGSDLDEGEELVEKSVTIVSTEASFSDGVDDEASTLKLSLTLDIEGVVAKSDDIFEMVENIVGDKVPSGYVLKDEQVDTVFKYIGEEDGVYEIDLRFKANLLPEVDPDEVTSKIVGRYPGVAQDYLTSIPGFTRAEVILKPRLPGRLGSLPRVEKNITIIITAEK